MYPLESAAHIQRFVTLNRCQRQIHVAIDDNLTANGHTDSPTSATPVLMEHGVKVL
jgi:hypothetical protein